LIELDGGELLVSPQLAAMLKVKALAA